MRKWLTGITNTEKAVITTGQGFPQGGVCSAKFWIVAFNEAINIINEHGATGNGFADDCVTAIGGTNLHTMMSRLQKVCDKLVDWGRTAGLTFNASKTEVIIFTKGRIKEKDMPNKLLMDDKRIEFGTECRYLGVTLDHRLSWTPHFTNGFTQLL